MKTKTIYIYIFSFSLLTAIGCTKDYTNPAALPEEEVFTDARATTGAAVGLQRRYAVSRASSLFNLVTANGFVTRELILLNAGNIPEAQLNTGGGTVDGTNTVLEGLWINSNKIIFDADRIISSAETFADKGYASVDRLRDHIQSFIIGEYGDVLGKSALRHRGKRHFCRPDGRF